MGMMEISVVALLVSVVAWDLLKTRQWLKHRKEQREPITFTYENLEVFIEQPDTQFQHGDIVILLDTGKRYERDGDAWQGVKK